MKKRRLSEVDPELAALRQVVKERVGQQGGGAFLERLQKAPQWVAKASGEERALALRVLLELREATAPAATRGQKAATESDEELMSLLESVRARCEAPSADDFLERLGREPSWLLHLPPEEAHLARVMLRKIREAAIGFAGRTPATAPGSRRRRRR